MLLCSNMFSVGYYSEKNILAEQDKNSIESKQSCEGPIETRKDDSRRLTEFDIIWYRWNRYTEETGMRRDSKNLSRVRFTRYI